MSTRQTFQYPLLVLCILLFTNTIVATEGFYKDVFVDEGVSLSGPSKIPALDYINLTWEWLDTEDESTQNKVMVESSDDYNGALLYPDGEPRFRLIYSHGGGMNHAGTLGDKGRNNIRSHYYHGGSHAGSCAGSYMLGSGSSTWYCIWPGDIEKEPKVGTTLCGIIPEDSPLLLYYDFGGDNYIENIYHHWGGHVKKDDAPDGTEFLLIHDKSNSAMDGHVSCWAWKDNDTTGRVIGITSHPEGSSSGETRDYMAAVLLHCIAGMAPPDVKGELVNGEPRVMDKETADNDPAFTKIGDMQYHFFSVALENGAKSMTVELSGESGYDMHLFAAKDTFAFAGIAEYSDSGSGAEKTLDIPTLDAGIWYIGVKCATSVITEKRSWGHEYTGNREVLNGVEYTITATWDNTDILAKNQIGGLHNRFALNKHGKNVYINVGKSQLHSLQVYDARGRLCWEADIANPAVQYTWQPRSAGMYLIRAQSGKEILTQRITITK